MQVHLADESKVVEVQKVAAADMKLILQSVNEELDGIPKDRLHSLALATLPTDIVGIAKNRSGPIGFEPMHRPTCTEAPSVSLHLSSFGQLLSCRMHRLR